MFSIYKTVHPPTGIENALFCNFINSKDRNLITTSANILQVYRLNPDDNKSKKLKFECIESFTLFGNVSTLASCRYGSMTKDALILAFDDAKISIVEYDSFNGDLTTLSIHYFENEMDPEGIYFNIYHPILKVDPNMRCAVMLIYGCKLVVIPFYEDHSTNANTTATNQQHALNETLIKAEPEFEQKFNPNQQDLLNVKKIVPSSSSSLSSYSIDLRKLDNWLETRIIDIEFLYGYYEPTLFILSESNRTWVGRYAVKKDTCNSIALSLNLHQKTHPLIWPVDKLPSDCLKCVAVPLPIGGALIFAVNSLIYINQSIPSYAVSLNSIAKTTSNYPFKNMEKTKISLDCSHSVFVAPDQLILSLKGGEIYIITLITDSESLRTIRSFNIEKGPGSVIASCLTKCFDNYLFFGSRLGNSILLKYSVKNAVVKPLVSNGDSIKPIDTNESEIMDTNVEELDYDLVNNTDQDQNDNNNNHKLDTIDTDNDELEQILVKNEEKINNSVNVVSYNFEICDMLLNVAPCGHSIIGETVGDFSEFNSESFQYHIDLITSSGHSKHGAVSVLQRSIRPEIIASFQIPDIIDMWSVFSFDSDSNQTTYLFLSKLDSTMILQMANEITELDRESTRFCTKLPTVYCGNLDNNKYILQITLNSLLIFSDSNGSSDAQLEFTYDLLPKLDSKIKFATTCDPYIVILTHKGTLLIFKFDSQINSVYLLEREFLSSISCFTLYKDENNFLMQQNYLKTENTENNNKTSKNASNSNNPNAKNYFEENNIAMNSNNINNNNNNNQEEMTVDDEDELLYGSSSTEISFKNIINSESSKTTLNLFAQNEPLSKKETDQLDQKDLNHVVPPSPVQNEHNCLTYWLITVSFDGTLNIYNLVEDNLNLTFIATKFNTAPKTLLLTTSGSATNTATTSNQPQVPIITPARSSLMENHQSYVNEILMIGTTWNEKSRPFLIAKIDEDLIIYEGFIGHSFNHVTSTSTNQLNFKRINHDAIIRDKKKRKTQVRKNLAESASASGGALLESDFKNRTQFTQVFRSFTNIAGFNGFFITGSHPFMVFLCPRTGVTPHPLWVDSAINSFVPLNNAAITLTGFIYLNKNFDIRICTLPMDDYNGKLQIYYDSPWILRKVQLRQTVHFICYHEESKTYAVVTSTLESTNKLMQLGGEDKELETFEKDENFILPNKDLFTIQLYASNVWEPLPLGKYTLGDCEHVSCLKLVSLPYEGHSSGFRTYLAASTINCYNEDVNSRGKVIVFDVIETVPEPDKPLTNTKMKVILEKEQKGPVTCLESVNGYLLGGVGQKVKINWV